MKYLFTLIVSLLAFPILNASEVHKISSIESKTLHELLDKEDYGGFIDYMSKNKISGRLFNLNSESWHEATYGAEEVIEAANFIILKGDFWISKLGKKVIEQSKLKDSYVKIDRKTMKIIELKGKYEGKVMYFQVLSLTVKRVCPLIRKCLPYSLFPSHLNL